ncbi:hypothetical protein JB92DRAFT_2869106 [Gautieria morchelliformis]|nr:hypothetical protein JB92DRAFT_2869106 [Gautieria morchelliformis]
MSSSSLSSVVSDLVRASMGAAVPKTVTDEELDRHIGEIILREAKQKAERYKQDGIRAYLPVTDSNVPRANKRFLSSIIRSTDDHNKAIQRSQAIAAAELKEEREEQERRERRARADEAAQDRLRRLMSGGRRDITGDRWRPGADRDRPLEGTRRERREYHSRSKEKTSKSPTRKRYWDEDEDEYQRRIGSSYRSSRHGSSRVRRHHYTASRSRSPRREKGKSTRRSHSNSNSHTGHKPSDTDSGFGHRDGSYSPRRENSSTPTGSSRDDSIHSDRRRSTRSPSRIPSRDLVEPKISSRTASPLLETSPIQSPKPTLGIPTRPPSPTPISSKMDKYFAPDYDPRLDVAPLASSSSGLTIDVPATGLVDNAQFEGWDAMLELIRLRREDRMEKKRLERLGLSSDNAKEGRGKKGKGMVSASAEDGKGIMAIEYTKKGAVREWDMGKETI